MYDVQYIEVSIVIIVNLSLELICDRFHIDVFVISLYFFELCNLCLYQSPDCFNMEFWLNKPKWMKEKKNLLLLLLLLNLHVLFHRSQQTYKPPVKFVIMNF